MPGSFTIERQGKRVTALDLPPVELPSLDGNEAYGEAVLFSVRNTGTTKLAGVTVGLRGKGKPNARIGLKSKPTANDPVRVALELKPGQSKDFWARACYRRGESEDGKDLEIFVTATSIG